VDPAVGLLVAWPCAAVSTQRRRSRDNRAVVEATPPARHRMNSTNHYVYTDQADLHTTKLYAVRARYVPTFRAGARAAPPAAPAGGAASCSLALQGEKQHACYEPRPSGGRRRGHASSSKVAPSCRFCLTDSTTGKLESLLVSECLIGCTFDTSITAVRNCSFMLIARESQ
jgi:hypothetical protein